MTLKNTLSVLFVCSLTFGVTAQTSHPTEIKSANKIQEDSAIQPEPVAPASSIKSLKPLVDYPEHWIVQVPESFPQKGQDYSRLVKEWITQNPDAWDAMVAEYTAKVDNGTTHKKQVNNLPAQTDENGLRILTKEQFDAFPIERQQFILNNPNRFRIQ